MQKIDPLVMRTAMVICGVAIAVVAQLWLKDSQLYSEVLLAAGALLGVPIRAPGHIDPSQLEQAAKMTSVPPPPTHMNLGDE